MSLAAVSENGDGFSLQRRRIGIAFIINSCHGSFSSSGRSYRPVGRYFDPSYSPAPPKSRAKFRSKRSISAVKIPHFHETEGCPTPCDPWPEGPALLRFVWTGSSALPFAPNGRLF